MRLCPMDTMWTCLTEFVDVLAGYVPGWTSEPDIALFKSLGHGLRRPRGHGLRPARERVARHRNARRMVSLHAH
jgi:hypothetical protein